MDKECAKPVLNVLASFKADGLIVNGEILEMVNASFSQKESDNQVFVKSKDCENYDRRREH